jgi:hypothetical protein
MAQLAALLVELPQGVRAPFEAALNDWLKQYQAVGLMKLEAVRSAI